MKRKAITILLTAALTASMLAGCGNSEQPNSQAGASGNGGAEAGQDGTSENEPGDDLSQHRTITAWLAPDDYQYFSKKDDAPVVKYLNEKFNCTVEFQQPPAGGETDAFNLMLGSGEYTDVMELSYCLDSVAVLYADGVIIDLAPYLEKYMPNYYAYLHAPENEEAYRAMYDEDGHCFSITSEAGDGTPTLNWGGMVYREDILETMTGGNIAFPSGNAEPITIEDWDYMLELMKQYFDAAQMVDSAALILPYEGYFPTGQLLNGFGTGGGFQVVDGKVSYGPTTDEFYNYLVKMHEWYEKGYIYQDFASRTNDLFFQPNTALTYGGAAGVFFGGYWQLGERMSMPEYGLNMMVKGASDPIDTEHGQTGAFGTLGLNESAGVKANTGAWAVSATCSMENMIRFMTWADFLFTEEGSMMKKYGLTGDLAANDPIYQQLGLEKGTYWFDEDGNFVSDERITSGEIEGTGLGGNRLPGINKNIYEYEQTSEEWKAADAVWGRYGEENGMPSGAYGTAEEDEIFADCYNSFLDYQNQMIAKFIMGTEELTEESYAAYVEQMNAKGVEDAVKVKQAMYDRYMSR